MTNVCDLASVWKLLFTLTSSHPCQSSRQVTLGGAYIRASGGVDGDWSLVVGRGGYKYFPSGYMLLECNLTGLVSCSHISDTLVRLRFVRLRFA